RALHEMATRNRSDIVIGKVASDFRPVPQHLFRHNVEACTIRDTSLISSLTPHKMFRTAFLREHGLEFPEGRVRLEDQLFMVRAYLVAQTVSILADRVCYLYRRRDDGGNAGNRTTDPAQYFGNLREILEVVVANTDPGSFRTELLSRFYKTGMLARISEPWFNARTPEGRAAVFGEVHGLADDFIDDDVERSLGTMRRLRSTLLRRGREAETLTLTARLRQLEAAATVDGMRWAGPKLEVELHAGLVLGEDRRSMAFVRRGGRAFLDPSLTDDVVDEPFEIVEPSPWGSVHLSLRERTTGTEWRVPAAVRVDLDQADAGTGEDRVHPVFRAVARVNVLRIAGGRQLPPGEWQLQVRVFGPGIDRRTSLAPGPGKALVPAMMATTGGGIVAVANVDANGAGVTVAAGSIEVPMAVPDGGAWRDTEVFARGRDGAPRRIGRIERRGEAGVLVVPEVRAFDQAARWRLVADAGGQGAPTPLVATLDVVEPGEPAAVPGSRPASVVTRAHRRARRFIRGSHRVRESRIVRILARRQ
ncbi:MAG TPA: hypothetical protein VGM28_08350, partial [Candidatus Limnocylindrales bacterium]